MTTKQAEVLTFIRTWQREKRYSPSLHEIASHCLQSPHANSAYKHITALVGYGLIQKDDLGRICMWRPLSLPCLEMGVRV